MENHQSEMNKNMESKSEKLKEFLSLGGQYLLFIVMGFALAFGIRYVIAPEVVVGQSMESSLHDGDYVITNKLAYKHDKPEYKEVVIFDSKNVTGDDLYIKRVIGLPGDKIEIKNNVLYRNGKKVNEPYIKEKMDTDDIALTVEKGKVFVMGDNRNNSLDSRTFGTIDYHDEVIGKVMVRLWPFNQDFKN